VDAAELGPVELGLDRVGQRGDGRRAVHQRRGRAEPGQVERENVVHSGQHRADAG